MAWPRASVIAPMAEREDGEGPREEAVCLGVLHRFGRCFYMRGSVRVGGWLATRDCCPESSYCRGEGREAHMCSTG